MTKPKTLKDLKVGDDVFVVYPASRYREEATSSEVVTRVGRKFAYIDSRRDQLPFCRETGRSHHKCCTVRANGGGFDVWLSERDYRKHVFNFEEKRRLNKRLVGSFGQLVDLAPEIVDKFNDILDSEGLD